MLPRYANTNIPHVAISTAILNTINSTNIETNAFHPAKDKLALDSSELIAQAKELFGDVAIDLWELIIQSKLIQNRLEPLTVNQKANLTQELLRTTIEDLCSVNSKFHTTHSM